MFDLSTNPFAVLGLSIRSGADEISQATEDAVFRLHVEEQKAHAAQRILLGSRTRLAAELSWLLDASPSLATKTLKQFDESKSISVAKDLIRSLAGISAANFAAHICGTGQGDEEILQALLEFHDGIDAESVQELVNSNRKVAGFPRVSWN